MYTKRLTIMCVSLIVSGNLSRSVCAMEESSMHRPNTSQVAGVASVMPGATPSHSPVPPADSQMNIHLDMMGGAGSVAISSQERIRLFCDRHGIRSLSHETIARCAESYEAQKRNKEYSGGMIRTADTRVANIIDQEMIAKIVAQALQGQNDELSGENTNLQRDVDAKSKAISARTKAIISLVVALVIVIAPVAYSLFADNLKNSDDCLSVDECLKLRCNTTG